MNDEMSINELCDASLDAWEEWLNKVLHAQSEPLRLVLRSMHSELADSSYADRLVEYGDKQIASWVEIEKEFVHVIFQSIKNMEVPFGYTQETGKSTAFHFIDHWGKRADKAIEAHSEFYSLIFPWDEGESVVNGEMESSVDDDTHDRSDAAKAA